ncbi:hypothetical protein D9M68_890420 [compost metagenome]
MWRRSTSPLPIGHSRKPPANQPSGYPAKVPLLAVSPDNDCSVAPTRNACRSTLHLKEYRVVVQVRLKVSVSPGRSMLDSMSWQLMVQLLRSGHFTEATEPT